MNSRSEQSNPRDPHANWPVLRAGPAISEAAAVLLLLHGRGASAQDILTLHDELNVPGVASIAPQAAGGSWYPQSFLAPLEANQPQLDSALRRVESIVTGLLADGVAGEQIAILGFSQGACLATEFAARHPRRYGAVMGLTGGLIGPPDTPHNYAGSLAGTAVFLGSGDPDPHVPFARVTETGEVLTAMGASVEVRRYAGMPHTINQDEMDACRKLVRAIASDSPKH